MTHRTQTAILILAVTTMLCVSAIAHHRHNDCAAVVSWVQPLLQTTGSLSAETAGQTWEAPCHYIKLACESAGTRRLKTREQDNSSDNGLGSNQGK